MNFPKAGPVIFHSELKLKTIFIFFDTYPTLLTAAMPLFGESYELQSSNNNIHLNFKFRLIELVTNKLVVHWTCDL